MAYEPKNWAARDKLAHEEFNRMEEGIQEALVSSPSEKVEHSLSNQASEYSDSLTYSVGDYCIYNNELYICVSEITDPEEWRESNWKVTTIGNEISDFYNRIYPVGSIYMSMNNSDPGDMFGGEWKQIPDVFLLGAGETYSSGDTGGEESVALSVKQIPNHTHSIPALSGTADSAGAHTHTGPSHTHSLPSHTHSFSATTGSSGSHSHTLNYNSNTAYSSGSSARLSGSGSSTNSSICNSNGSHTHSVSGTTGSTSGTSGSSGTGATGSSGSHTHTVTIESNTTGETGSSSSHNNMPPYLAVYMWQRIA